MKKSKNIDVFKEKGTTIMFLKTENIRFQKKTNTCGRIYVDVSIVQTLLTYNTAFIFSAANTN